MKVHFTDIVPDPEGSNWVNLYAIANGGLYYIQAKVFTEGSEYGIYGGRVSMLWIEKHSIGNSGAGRCGRSARDVLVADYDRGTWNRRPGTPAAKAVVESVVDLFDNHWEETGLKPTKNGWIIEKHASKDES